MRLAVRAALMPLAVSDRRDPFTAEAVRGKLRKYRRDGFITADEERDGLEQVSRFMGSPRPAKR